MSEVDSSSDEGGFHPSLEENSLDWKLKQKCWECGESFRYMRLLMTHYQNHNVEATCHICHVTFRRMTSLSTHLINAHSGNLHCKPCNQLFKNIWDFNKHKYNRHQGTHLISAPSNGKTETKDLPTNVRYEHVAKDHAYGCENAYAIKPRGDPASKLRPLMSVETQRERPEPTGEYGNDTLRPLEVGDIEMEIPYQSESDESEDTDDSANYQDDEAAVGDVDNGNLVAPGNQAVGCVEEQNDDTDTASDKDSDHSLDDKALDSGSESSSSGSSSSTSSSDGHSVNIPTSMCGDCGRGPFRNVKIHLLHCTGKRPGIHCPACKRSFTDEKSMKEHCAVHRLHACDVCNQVFTHSRSYVAHHCLKPNFSRPSTIIYSCAPSIPNKCNLCKAFFPTQKDMLKHIVTDHSDRVSIVNKAFTSTVKHMSPNDAVSTTEAHLVSNSPSLALESKRPEGRLSGRSMSGSLPSLVISSSPPVSVSVTTSLATGGTTSYILFNQPPTTGTQVAPQKSETRNQLSSQMRTNLAQLVAQKESFFNGPEPIPSIPGQPSAPILLTVSGPTGRLGTAGTSGQVMHRAPGPLSAATPVSVASKTSSPPTPPLTIVAIFKNDSRELALKKRMKTSWRSKATYPCRQCGAVSRQPALSVSHRYLHRGHRSHRCHCGRTFLCRLHLLRHCMQHAEATSYVCVNCGETFEGAKLLAEHMKGISRRPPTPPGGKLRRGVRTKCKAALSCDCGQIFVRPSAYIWHQLKNTPKAESHKKPSK